jgi:hypothetical protein
MDRDPPHALNSTTCALRPGSGAPPLGIPAPASGTRCPRRDFAACRRGAAVCVCGGEVELTPEATLVHCEHKKGGLCGPAGRAGADVPVPARHRRRRTRAPDARAGGRGRVYTRSGPTHRSYQTEPATRQAPEACGECVKSVARGWALPRPLQRPFPRLCSPSSFPAVSFPLSLSRPLFQFIGLSLSRPLLPHPPIPVPVHPGRSQWDPASLSLRPLLHCGGRLGPMPTSNLHLAPTAPQGQSLIPCDS